LHAVATQLHVTTREDVIRRFLLVKQGDICTELRRTESERILRAQPFLAEARIVVLPSIGAGVVLDVRTTDEVAVILGGSVVTSGPALRAVKFGNSNIAGTTTYLAGSWREGGGYRDELGLRFEHQQLFGRPYAADVQIERHSLGDRWVGETAHPFYTDLQRIAWRARSGSSIDYIRFPTDSALSRAVRLDRGFFDVGGMFRVGHPGRLALFGVSLSGDRDVPASSSVIVGPTSLATDADSTLRGRYDSHRSIRGNLLWGVRDIRFRSMTGFDALTGTQDIPVGIQLGTMFGRTLSALGSQDDDIFLSSDIYIGAAGQRSTFRVQARGEGRRRTADGMWDGILTSGRVAQYVRPSARNVLVGSLEWSGGWKQRIPFNLSLSDVTAGVRGFTNSALVGGRRAVARAESRWVLGAAGSLGDVGAATFADVGKLLPGDVPFGSRSPYATSLGVSLLAAAPRHSARMWRMDVAFPIHGNPDAGRVEIRFSGADNTKFFFREPADVERTRELTVPSSVFRWP
jgi:hypothetical protein